MAECFGGEPGVAHGFLEEGAESVAQLTGGWNRGIPSCAASRWQMWWAPWTVSRLCAEFLVAGWKLMNRAGEWSCRLAR